MHRLLPLVSVLPAGLLLAGCAVAGTISTGAPSPSTGTGATPIGSVPAPLTSMQPASGSPSATFGGSVAPTTPADPVGLAPDSYAKVVTNDLRVRSKPGVAEDSMKLEPLLQDGIQLLVLDGPVAASGYDWYQVKPIFDADTPEGGYPLGWVARAGKDGEPWIESQTHACPPIPTDVTGLSSLFATAPPYAAITCYSGQEISFKALLQAEKSFSCGVDGPAWGVEPEWLDGCQVDSPFLAAVDNWGLRVGPQWAPSVDMAIVPDTSDPPDAWPVVEVTGQFDHPEARSCRNRLDDPNSDVPEPNPALTVLNCRQSFVVTSMHEIHG